jgi:hypothetical protein
LMPAWVVAGAVPMLSAQDVASQPGSESKQPAPALEVAQPSVSPTTRIQSPGSTTNPAAPSGGEAAPGLPGSWPKCEKTHATATAVPPGEMQTLPVGTHITVVLDTPISTRISKVGQVVEFKVASPYLVEGHEVIAIGTEFNGRVIGVQRPGSFSRNGEIRVVLEGVTLPGGAQVLRADLQPADPKASFSAKSDSPKTLSAVKKAAVVGQGALVGAQIGGGQGALIGAAAGGTVLLIIGLSKHGRDVYLEPGTPFDVVLRSPLAISLSDTTLADCKEPLGASEARAANGNQYDDASANGNHAEDSAETPDGAEDDNAGDTPSGKSGKIEITPRSVPQPPL